MFKLLKQAIWITFGEYMALINTQIRFGRITKLLHWSIFILVVIQYALVYRRAFLPEEAPEKLQYILLHKSFGLVIFGLVILMILNRQFGQRPPYPKNAPWYQNLLAKMVHFLLYVCLLFMPIAGVLMTFFSGRTLAIFGYLLPTPSFIHTNKALAELFYKGHVFTSYIILGLVSLHIIGAFYHHFILKDNILTRMLPEK